MNIAFLNPPYMKKFSRPQRSPAVTKSGTLYYPMWLAYAAAVAEKDGHTIDLIDAPADGHDMEYVLERIMKFSPKIIVVETSTPSIYNDVQVCEKLRQKMPDTCILLVGTHVSALPEESLGLSSAVDAVAVGEYDYTVRDIAQLSDPRQGLEAVPGLCCRREGTVLRTEARPMIDNLDDIPFVSSIYQRFLRMENYFNPNALFPMVTITTTRGCPFQCIFCVYPQTMMGHRLRMRSVQNVVDEVASIAETFPGVRAIFFEDDTFTAVKKRCIEISQEIVRRGIRISWTANARAELDYETMKAMKESGCRCLCVGFESGSQMLLDTIKKRINTEKMTSFMEDARRAGILIHGCFMVGHPGETKETMQETLELAKRLNPDTVQFYPIMVYPGTEAYEWYRSRGLIATDDFSKWLTPSGLHNTVVRSEALTSEEIVKFCDHARRAFYLRPGYLFYKLRQTLKDPAEMQRTVKSARTFLKYLVKGSDVEGKSC